MFSVLGRKSAESAHLNLCTERITLLFQLIHFSFLSCHGDSCERMLRTGDETVSLKQEEKENVRRIVRLVFVPAPCRLCYAQTSQHSLSCVSASALSDPDAVTWNAGAAVTPSSVEQRLDTYLNQSFNTVSSHTGVGRRTGKNGKSSVSVSRGTSSL